MLETPSLYQGRQFQSYMKNNYNKSFFKYNTLKEGFDINTRDILNKYQQLQSQKVEIIQQAVDRTNPNANPYLNKSVRFSTGQYGYVTNKGVLKYIPTDEIFQNSGVPKNYISLSIAWDDSWKTGTIIPTSPSLILGEPLQSGQQIGNEGNVVYVKDVLDSRGSTPSYIGCYADTFSSPQMTFLSAKPTQTNIQNGNFYEPVLPINSYELYINQSNAVPGWVFNAILSNQSQTWNIPIPYPSGSQCVIIQGEQQNIQQTIALNSGIDYVLSWFVTGTNPITIALSNSDGNDSRIIYNSQPNATNWLKEETHLSVSISGNYLLIFQGGSVADNSSISGLQNILLTIGNVEDSELSSWEDCRQNAMENGYLYFALQEANINSNKGYCAVSNNLPSLGNSTTIIKQVLLWTSNTTGSGNYAFLSPSGTLTIINNEKTIFSTQNDTTPPANYIGCYTDQSTRAIPLLKDGNSWNNNYSSAFSYATANKMNYFSIQSANQSGYGQAGFTNDITTATKYGKATNCKQVNGYYVGGAWSNAIYSVNYSVAYYLILLDNGNMEIHLGKSPDDDQGLLWQTNTTGKQQMETELYSAQNGKFAKNWCPVGGTLMSGEFIGSPSGNLALIMQPDGSLVLYTFQTGANCQKMTDGNIGGGTLANAVYSIGLVGEPSTLGTLAYIDADSQLYPYSREDTILTDDFIKVEKRDIFGGDIVETSQVSENLKDCQNKCIGLDDCVGIIWDKTNKICYPKNNVIQGRMFNETKDLYIRQRKPIQEGMTNIDSYQYQKYKVATKNNKQNKYNIDTQIKPIKTQIDIIEKDVNNITGKLTQSSVELQKNILTNQQKMAKSETELDKYIANYQLLQQKMKTNKKMLARDENIVTDSNIVVSERNYEYILWCAVAVGVFIVGGNILKQ